MASYHEEEDPFEEDIVFDQAGLLNSSSKINTAIRRVSSGKCVLFAKTLGLCGAFFGLGLCIAIPGPTFLSPLTELESSLSPISNTYIARTSGYIVGSVIGGVLFDRFNRLFLLFLSLLLTAVFITITPWCQALWVLESCMIVLGITMGFLDTGGNVLCLDLWGRNSGPFMQALHFSFGLGAIVAPLLAAPFLEPTFGNSTLSTELSHPITEFPVHLEDSTAVLFHDERLRRDIEEQKIFSNISDITTRNVPNVSVIPDLTLNISSVPSSLVSPNENSSVSVEAHTDSSSYPVSTPSTPTKPRVPKRKPITSDTNLLNSPKKDWDKVRVRKPPLADLLPLSTSPIPVTSLTQSSSAVASSISSSVDDTVSSITVPSVSFSTTPVSKPSIPQKFTSPITDAISGAYQSAIKSVASDSTPTPFHHFLTDAPNISLGALNYEKSLGKISLSVNSSTKPVGDVPLNLVNNSMELKRNLTNFAFDDTQNLPMKNEDHSQFTMIIPLATQQSYFYQRKDNKGVEATNSGSTTVNHTSLTNISHNDTTLAFGSRESIRHHGSDEMSEKNTEKLFKEKFNIIEGNENLSKSLERSSSVSSPQSDHFTESFKSQKPVDISISNPYDDNTMFQRENSSTDSSVASLDDVQKNEGIVSVNSLDVTSSLNVPTATPSHPHHIHHKPGTFDNDTEHINTIFDIFANRIEQYGFNKIQFTYLIVGIFVFLISFIFLGFLCHNPRDPKSKQEGQGDKNITNKVVHKLFVALMALFFFLYMGLEVTYGQLVLAFSMYSNLRLTQSTGSVISVVFWSSFAAMRFASIFFASGFSPVTMLMLNFGFCTTGTILVLALANKLETALWVGTVLIGVGLASMFPTGILWIERYIHVTNKVAAVFVIGVALGKMVCHVTIYKLMVIDPILFMYAALVINIICIFIFASLWWLASRQGEKYSVINNNGYQLANQHDEEEDMMDMSPSGSGVLPRRHCFSSEHRSLLNGNMHRGP